MNLNRLNIIHNQSTEHNDTECEGITVSGIVGNLLGIPSDPDFSYAMALRAAGQAPTTAGSDPYAAMMGAVLWGVLPETSDTFDAADKGELYVANPDNYSAFQYGDALTHTMKGVKTLYTFDEIKAEIDAGNPVNLGLAWYKSFNATGADGILPPASGPVHLHSVAVYDATADYLLIEVHLGSNFGLGGYVKLSRDRFPSVFKNAYAFDPTASRWSTIVGYLALRFNLYKYIPELLKANQPTMTYPMVSKWANAVEHWEGADAALNNPGNLKYSTLTASWGATPGRKASDGGYLCKFPTYSKGYAALYHFLLLGCEDELKAFHQARSLEAFSKVYGGNPPQGYIDGIAHDLGVSVDTLIASFLN